MPTILFSYVIFDMTAISIVFPMGKNHPDLLMGWRHAAKEQIVGEIWFQTNSGGRQLLGRFGQCPQWLLLVRETLGLHGSEPRFVEVGINIAIKAHVSWGWQVGSIKRVLVQV